MDKKDFMCILFYIFKISFFIDETRKEDYIFVIPQLKLMHMKDDNFVFETGGLSTGIDVFFFDIEPEQSYESIGKSKNILFSIICSDVFEYKEFIEFIKNRNAGFYVFHPQLNEKPKHGVFLSFRKELFDINDKDIVLVTSTWGKGTKINGKKLEQANSAIYLKSYDTKNYLDHNIQLVCTNHLKKTTVGISRDRVKWLFPNNQYYILYNIMKPNNKGYSSLSKSVNTPYIKGISIFDNSEQKFLDSKACLYKPAEVLNILSDDMPVRVTQLIEQICDEKNCEQCKIYNFFYFMGSFFHDRNNDFIEYTLQMDENENCYQIRPDNRQQEIIKNHIVKIREFIKCIKENMLPDELKELFALGANFYIKNGSRMKEIYNISFDKTYKKVRLVFAGTKSFKEVENLFDELIMDTENDEEAKSIIIMYYDEDDCELKFYHKLKIELNNDTNYINKVSRSEI